MREIKFRAKDTSNNWCYGQLIIGNNYDFIITESDYDAVVATLDTLVCQCHPIKKGSDTIGQFTGLKDKNGKDIYEGDIIKQEDSKLCYKIVFEKSMCAFRVICGIDNMGIGHYIKERFKIVGNVFDNPELLKGE